jgi:hypothetical protein
MYPMAMRFTMLHDPGLAAAPEATRQKRLRTAPMVFGALMLGVGLVIGLADVAFFWAAIYVIGWSMKRRPNDVLKMTKGGLPSPGLVLDMLFMALVAAASVGLGHAIA